MTTAEATGPNAGETARPWQFSLWQLLLVMAGVCVLGAGYQWFGPPVICLAGFLLLVGLIALGVTRKNLGLLAIVAMLVMLAGLMLPSPGSRPPGPRAQCNNKFKMIVLALQSYRDAYGQFPPACIADESGRPMHSWRVLILPFLEHKPLYDAYRFDEPWDGPNNSKLASVMLKIYCCPADHYGGSATCETSYVAVVGPSTAWPGTMSTRLGDIKDGAGNTILLVEVHNSGIPWMEPRDLGFQQLPLAINPPSGKGISSGHKSGANVGLADGSVIFLPNDTPPETVRAMLTIAGGETVARP
jgi:prepilin-type processing-associated H-X9-DG protein